MFKKHFTAEMSFNDSKNGRTRPVSGGERDRAAVRARFSGLLRKLPDNSGTDGSNPQRDPGKGVHEASYLLRAPDAEEPHRPLLLLAQS